ncbi:hypothetical protein AX774_g4147 [Zancudomyces culisetae]|uniref:Secreted protein n=1 Tax=Zancudomyces culisetae TaxID=1213189 RepID=A0A1R1PN59_ZANCU|nr:hypothetical protein AX774_g4147 [Zancudomyces culisetae]|eukprot:OMH82371.1 hypothetical protein AX774_g4147 [Zancudomyces culisetae]
MKALPSLSFLYVFFFAIFKPHNLFTTQSGFMTEKEWHRAKHSSTVESETQQATIVACAYQYVVCSAQIINGLVKL